MSTGKAVKAELAIEYIDQEAATQLESRLNQLAGALESSNIDVNKVLVLAAEIKNIRHFQRQVRNAIKKGV